MQDVNDTFASRIAALMHPDEKQEAFADRIGIGQGTVSEWLSGAVRAPKRATLEVVGRNSGAHPEWLRKGGTFRPYPVKEGEPIGDQMQRNLETAKHLDRISDATARYGHTADELSLLIQECDERKAVYQEMLATLHRAHEHEIALRDN